MADDPFGLADTQQSIAATLAQQAKAKQNLAGTLQQTNQMITQSSQTFATQLENLNRQSETVYQSADEALTRIEAIESNPRIVNRVMALFDSDFDIDAQNAKLRRAQFESTRIQQQSQTAKSVHQNTVRQAEARLATSTQMFEFTRQGFLDQTKMLELGFKIEDEIDERTLKLAQNAPMEQLNAWRADISTAPKPLQNKPGLLDSVFFSRRAEQLGVADTELAVQLKQMDVLNAREDEFIENLQPDQLRAFAENPDQIPEGISPTKIRDEWNRQLGVQLDLESARLGIAQGNAEFVTEQKKRILSSLRPDELERFSVAAMENKGRIAIQDVPFTLRELQNATTLALEEQAERRNRNEQLVLNTAGTQAMAINADNSINSIASILNPGTDYGDNAIAALPPDLQAYVVRQQQLIETSSELGGAAVPQLLEELNVRLADYQKELIDASPEESQAAMTEYMQKGFILNGKANADYLSTTLPNSTLLDYDNAYGPIWREFSRNYDELAGQEVDSTRIMGGDSSTAGISIVKEQEPESTVLMDRAARRTRQAASGHLWQQFAIDTLEELHAAAAEQAGASGVNIWDGLANFRTGRWKEDAYKHNPQTGARVFSAAQFSDFLARQTVALRNQGALGPDETLNELFINAMQQNAVGYVQQHSQGDMNKAAVNHALFGNRPERALLEFTGGLDKYTDTAISIVEERQQRLREATGAVIGTAASGTEAAASRAQQESIFSTASP